MDAWIAADPRQQGLWTGIVMVTRHVEIAGAGITGLTLAAALAQSGWTVRVHESAAELRSTGGGLYLREDGAQAARRLGIWDEILEGAFAPAGLELRVDGRQLSVEPEDPNVRTMLRNHLHGTLATAARRAGAEILFGSKVVAASADGHLDLADGSRRKADLVVAADGVGSAIPASLGIAARRLRYDDGLIRVLLDRRVLVGEQWERTIDFWHYGETALRILYSPCSPQHCYLCLMSAVGDDQASALPIAIDYWSRAFPELRPLLAQPGTSARYDRYGMIRLEQWSRGRAAVIGDAAHGMPSSLGRGASVGMLSAVELAARLADSASIEAALGAWETGQRPLVELVQAEAERVAGSRSLAERNRIDADSRMSAATVNAHVLTGERP